MLFKDYIKEMSIAGYGDWKPSKEMIGTKSAFVVRSKWVKIKKFTTRSNRELILYKSPKGFEYIAGEFKITSNNEEIFEIDFEISLTQHKSIANSFKIKEKLFNVDGVKVKENKQGDGIAYNVYKILVKNEKFTILGDEIQYFGARKLWSRLSKSLDVVVDIIDINKEQYIEKDVLLTHGNYDHEFDKRVWDYDDSKISVRLILKDLK